MALALTACGGNGSDEAGSATGGDRASASQQVPGESASAPASGASAEAPTDATGADGDAAPASDSGADDSDGEDAVDIGTVTVTIGSGPLAGTHSGTGSLKCSAGIFGGDEHWIVFSTDIEDSNDVTVINGFSAPEDQKDNPSSPYRGQAFVLDVGTGNFLIDQSKKISIDEDNPGTQGDRGIDGNTMRMSGTTADGVDIAVEAHCPAIDTSPVDSGGAGTTDDAGASTPGNDEASGDDEAAGGTVPSDVAPASQEFCDALKALNNAGGNAEATDQARAAVAQAIDTLVNQWPAETKAMAETYFDAISTAVASGEDVDLENASPEFVQAFSVVLDYTAAACPSSFQ